MFLYLYQILLTSLIFFISLSSIYADTQNTIRKSIRAQGMGDAFIAVANDEDLLFYNPAGLAALKGSIINAISLNVAYNENLNTLTTAQTMSDLFDSMMGKKIYAEGHLSGASFVKKNFGYSLFTGAVLDLETHTASLPYFDTQAYLQTGFATGFAFSFSKSLDMGLTLNSLQREGVVDQVSLSQFADIDPQNASVADLESLGISVQKKSDFGLDWGMMYHITQSSSSNLRLAFVIKNLKPMDMGTAGGVLGTTYNGGLAFETDLFYGSIILALEHADITYQTTEYKSPQRNMKMGVEFLGGDALYNGHPLYSLRLGQKGVYPSYGFSLNLWGAKVDYASWSEEYGRYAGDKEDKRQALQLSLIF